MKPLLHPSSVFIFWVISINIPASLYADDDSHYYTNCTEAFACEGSNVQSLKYPFWGGNRADYCGQSQLKLVCEDGVAKITINSITYRVIKWENTTQKLTVARDDFWGGVCHVSDYKKSSFHNSPFQYDGTGDVNVTFLYHCGVDLDPYDGFLDITCHNGIVVFYFVGPLSFAPACVRPASVVIPIFATQVSAIESAAGDINEALKEGFWLKWNGNYQECRACVGSGGVCGSDGEFRCFCKDGPHTSSCNSEIAPAPDKRRGSTTRKILIGALGAGFMTILFFVLIICHRMRSMSFRQKMLFRKRRKYVDHDVEAFMKSYGSLAPRLYSYSEVKRITNSFLHKLGQGGYGVVYKATLPDGRLVAVKVISESNGSGEDFINEVASISNTSHVNIVSLLGFCYDMNRRALIYEFMPNGSLDNFINGRGGSPNAVSYFDWNTLSKVAIGIARGLEYLHQGCNTRILHLDIKPQNILLDEDFCPKIADFGLSKICKRKESIVSMLGTRGTPGYIAPEVFSRAFGGVSHKSDVYSYGMLILEMVGGRENYDSGGGSQSSEMYFPDWIYKDLEQGDVHSNCLVGEEHEMARKMILVSLWCIQTRPSERPSMSKVVEMLEGTLKSVPYPPKPILHSPEKLLLQNSDLTSGNTLETDSMTTQKDGSIEWNVLSKNVPG